MNFIDYLQKSERKELSELFQFCPSSVRQSVEIIEAEKGKSFIMAGTECCYIYILLRGRARGIEIHLEEKIYIFRNFVSGQILGEMESFANFPSYLATIQAMQKCTLARLPSALYLAWMKRDEKALFLRTQKLVTDLTNQVKEARNYLFMSCYDRMILFFINLLAEQNEANSRADFFVKKTRLELANLLGFSVKTVNRTIIQLQKDGLVNIEHGKITLSQAQFQAISDYCDEHFLAMQL